MTEAEIEWHENKCCCQDLQIAIKANRAWLKKDTALEEENERLKADLEEAWKHCKAVDEVNAKLRCCDNCKHVKYDWDDQLRIGKCKTCTNLSNWEMRQ